MALYAISDLHLSFGTDKPMDVFGTKWGNYEERLKNNWNATVSNEDFVIINGDVSWATYLENAEDDFRFIDQLNGKKIISKGNHDYWWSTLNKNKEFCMEHNFLSIDFLHNNYFMYGNVAICGTRGWQLTTKDDSDMKIYNREIMRLENSIQQSLKENPSYIIAVMHYPPDEAFVKVLNKYNVPICIYGHLHGASGKNAMTGIVNSIDYKLVSCDFLDFIPIKIID